MTAAESGPMGLVARYAVNGSMPSATEKNPPGIAHATKRMTIATDTAGNARAACLRNGRVNRGPMRRPTAAWAAVNSRRGRVDVRHPV